MYKSDISQMTLGAVIGLMRTAEAVLRKRDFDEADVEALEIYDRLRELLQPFKDQLQDEDKSAYLFVAALTGVLIDHVHGFIELLETAPNETRH